MNKRIMLLLVMVFVASSVCALGVTPGRTTIEFEPGLYRNVNFDVINSANKDMTVILSAQGNLSEYISISSPSVLFSAGEGSKSASYTLNLPDSLSPGLHTGKVVIVQLPDSSNAEESAVLATLAVVTQVYVNVPYPGKFAEADFVIYDANAGDEAMFVFPVSSKGEFDLTSVRASVDIYDSLNEKIDSFQTESIAIPSGERKEVIYNWRADVPVGSYRAVASLVYDEGTINLEKVFSVGSEELELQEINVNKFSLGDIVKLEMLIENKWSEPVANAYIETKIMNDRGAVVSRFESASHDVDALSKKSFTSYWDTAGVRVGDYEAEVSINYGDSSSKKNLGFEVSENDLKIIGLGYVISGEGDGGMNALVITLIVIIVLLVLINLLWFLILRKKFKK